MHTIAEEGEYSWDKCLAASEEKLLGELSIPTSIRSRTGSVCQTYIDAAYCDITIFMRAGSTETGNWMCSRHLHFIELR